MFKYGFFTSSQVHQIIARLSIALRLGYPGLCVCWDGGNQGGQVQIISHSEVCCRNQSFPGWVVARTITLPVTLLMKLNC